MTNMVEDKKSHSAISDLTLEAAVSTMGTEQTLHNKFSFWSAFGILLCCSGAWEGLIASIAQSLISGSSVSLLWGWVVVSIGMIVLACSLSELASRFPTSGGQYHWVFELAPPKLKIILSWYTCWLSIAALCLGSISCTMGVAVQVQAYVSLGQPNYIPERWHVFLIAVLVTFIALFVNVFYAKFLHQMNLAIIAIHLAGYITVISVMAAMAKDKHDAAFVFTHFENNSGWSNDGVAWCVGLLTSIYAYFSLDSSTHYAEEVENASISIPRAIILQVIINAVMTFPFIIALLFCIGDVTAVLESPIGYTSPFTQIIQNITGSPAGSIFLAALSTTVAFAACLDLYGAAARMLWSLSRDHGLPHMFSLVHRRYDVPVWSLLILLVPSIIIPMIYIWNSTAFYGIMASVLVFFQTSYFLPIFINVLYGRWRGDRIRSAWSMGRTGWTVDILSSLWSAFAFVFMSFPTAMPLTGSTMNYASSIFGAVFIIATVLWVFYARSRYYGPVYTNELRHQVIEGRGIADTESASVPDQKI